MMLDNAKSYMWLGAEQMSWLHEEVGIRFEVIHSIASPYSPITLVHINNDNGDLDALKKYIDEHQASAEANDRDDLPF